MSVYFLNSLPNDQFSSLLIVAVFYNSPFSRKTSSPAKNLFLPTFTEDKIEILAFCLSKLYWALSWSIFLWVVVIFSVTAVLMNNLIEKLYPSLKMKMVL